ETIFSDIEKLSDYRIKVPEGLTLNRISSDMSYSRPGLNPVKTRNNPRMKNNQRKNQRNK
ncbi:MAG: hypothetical protein ACI4TM_11895, partial [Candidatus Cryptobacteroides sp.]